MQNFSCLLKLSKFCNMEQYCYESYLYKTRHKLIYIRKFSHILLPSFLTRCREGDIVRCGEMVRDADHFCFRALVLPFFRSNRFLGGGRLGSQSEIVTIFVNPVHKILRNFSKIFKTKNISLCVLLNLKISTFLQKRECPAPSVDFL